jgi:hypothetical protein
MVSIKNIICELCKRSFVSKWHLQRHLKRKVPCDIKIKHVQALLREECNSPKLTIHGDIDDL